MDSLRETLFAIANSHNLKTIDLIARTKSDPILDALYRCWLIATDISNDATRDEMDKALTRIDRIAKQGLGL